MVDRWVRVTAYESMTKQAKVLRRVAAGETILVTNNDLPQVETRKAPTNAASVACALDRLRALQTSRLAVGATGRHQELRRLLEEGLAISEGRKGALDVVVGAAGDA